MEYHSAVKRNRLLIHSTTCMNPQRTMLSEKKPNPKVHILKVVVMTASIYVTSYGQALYCIEHLNSHNYLLNRYYFSPHFTDHDTEVTCLGSHSLEAADPSQALPRKSSSRACTFHHVPEK